ncbi:hypothetical protein MKW92_026349, partial [Papaver armeniacum]
MAALAEEDGCLDKNRALSSSTEPIILEEGEGSKNRKRLRNTDTETEDLEIVVSHQPNLNHINPIFQSSETVSSTSTEMNHQFIVRSTANQIVEGDVEMRDGAFDTHVLGNLNNGAQGGTANK